MDFNIRTSLPSTVQTCKIKEAKGHEHLQQKEKNIEFSFCDAKYKGADAVERTSNNASRGLQNRMVNFGAHPQTN